MATQAYKDRRMAAAQARNAQRLARQADLRRQLAANRADMRAEDTHLRWLAEMPVDPPAPAESP